MSHEDVEPIPSTDQAQAVTRQVVKGGVWVAISGYWTIAFGFIANIFLTRILSADDFGGFALAMFFAQLYRVQSRLGLDKAYAQHPESDATSVGTFLGLEALGTALSLLIGLASLFVLPTLGYSRQTSLVALILMLSLILESWNNDATSVMDKALHFNKSSGVDAICFPLSYIPAFWLAYNGGGIWSLVAQSLSYNLLTSIVKWWLGSRLLGGMLKQPLHYDRELAKQFLAFGLSVGLVTLISTLAGRLDTWLIGTFHTETELGFYDRAYRMSQWPVLLFSNLIHRLVYITYARIQQNQAYFRRVAEQITWILLVVAVPLALVLLFTAEELIVLFYGDKWLSSVPYLRILAIASIGYVLWANANALYTALGKPRQMVIWSSIQLGTMLLFGFPMTIYYKATGTALAVCGALFISTLIEYVDLARRHKLSLGKVILPLLLYGVVLGIIYYVFQSFLPPGQSLVLQLVLKVALLITGYIALLMVFSGKLVIQRIKGLWAALKPVAS